VSTVSVMPQAAFSGPAKEVISADIFTIPTICTIFSVISIALSRFFSVASCFSSSSFLISSEGNVFPSGGLCISLIVSSRIDDVDLFPSSLGFDGGTSHFLFHLAVSLPDDESV
jgi:hypothetical protein